MANDDNNTPSGDNTTLKDEKKKLIIDVLTKMYLEQNTHSRHHETQRSIVTTIFTTLGVALLGLIGTLWKAEAGLNVRFLPFTVPLILIGIFGLIIITKLFERSMLCLSISGAYLDVINTLLANDVLKLLNGEKDEMRYLKNAKSDYVLKRKKKEEQPYTVAFPSGKRMEERLDQNATDALLQKHDPINPGEIIVPIHNATAKFFGVRFANVDLWKSWMFIYVTFIVIGFFLSILSAFGDG